MVPWYRRLLSRALKLWRDAHPLFVPIQVQRGSGRSLPPHRPGAPSGRRQDRARRERHKRQVMIAWASLTRRSVSFAEEAQQMRLRGMASLSSDRWLSPPPPPAALCSTFIVLSPAAARSSASVSHELSTAGTTLCCWTTLSPPWTQRYVCDLEKGGLASRCYVVPCSTGSMAMLPGHPPKLSINAAVCSAGGEACLQPVHSGLPQGPHARPRHQPAAVRGGRRHRHLHEGRPRGREGQLPGAHGHSRWHVCCADVRGGCRGRRRRPGDSDEGAGARGAHGPGEGS